MAEASQSAVPISPLACLIFCTCDNPAFAAAFIVYVQGQFDSGDRLRRVLIVVFVAIFTDSMFRKPSQIAPASECATG